MNNIVKIAWAGKHIGEEPAISGNNAQGSGTIFFSGCNLHCVFCQNFQISQQGLGKEYSITDLAKMMIDLQDDGAININLVTPTIWHEQIIEAIKIAKNGGLIIPIVWNSNGYEAIEIIEMVAPYIDIFLPDFKYGIAEIGEKYSGVKDYPDIARLAIEKMLELKSDYVEENGLARKGVIVRHLILPNNLENSIGALDIISRISRDLPVSLMRQFYPLAEAKKFPELSRTVSEEEFETIFQYQINLGLENGWVQEGNCEKFLIPDFEKVEPFSF